MKPSEASGYGKHMQSMRDLLYILDKLAGNKYTTGIAFSLGSNKLVVTRNEGSW